MFKMNTFIFVGLFCVIGEQVINGCLITNCPRGGKRNGKFSNLEVANVKPCISCGSGRNGQCFGANICCGPFGCLIGTPETIKCQKEGMFHETEPCIAGSKSCRRHTGRCANEGICCTQESCHMDKTCTTEEKPHDLAFLDIYNLLNYQAPMEYINE